MLPNEDFSATLNPVVQALLARRGFHSPPPIQSGSEAEGLRARDLIKFLQAPGSRQQETRPVADQRQAMVRFLRGMGQPQGGPVASLHATSGPLGEPVRTATSFASRPDLTQLQPTARPAATALALPGAGLMTGFGAPLDGATHVPQHGPAHQPAANAVPGLRPDPQPLVMRRRFTGGRADRDVRTDGDDDRPQDQLSVPDPNDPEEIRAAGIGRILKEVLRRILPSRRGREERVEPPDPGPIEKLEAAETLLEVARRRFRENNSGKVRIEFSELGDTINPQAAIEQFVKTHREGRLVSPKSNETVQLGLGRVSQENAERILDEIGIDITGYHRMIDTQGVTHAFSSHGPGNETRSDQVPISNEAVSLYVDIANNPDTISMRPKTRSELATIEYRRQINGHAIIVEEIRTGRRKLAFKSMYIKKSK